MYSGFAYIEVEDASVISAGHILCTQRGIVVYVWEEEEVGGSMELYLAEKILISQSFSMK